MLAGMHRQQARLPSTLSPTQYLWLLLLSTLNPEDPLGLQAGRTCSTCHHCGLSSSASCLGCMSPANNLAIRVRESREG